MWGATTGVLGTAPKEAPPFTALDDKRKQRKQKELMRARTRSVNFHSIKESIVLRIRGWSTEENGIGESKMMRTEIGDWICPLEGDEQLSHQGFHRIMGQDPDTMFE